MHIAQVMQMTAKEPDYEATHTLFDQSMFPAEAKIGDGVCHALCKVWLKRTDIIGIPHMFHPFISLNVHKVVEKQKKASQKGYQSPHLKDPDGVSIFVLVDRR